MVEQLPFSDAEVAAGSQAPATSGFAPALGGDATKRAARQRHAASRRALAVAPGRSGTLVEIAGADWHIDEHTKAVGLAGIAAARRALAEAVSRAAA